MLRTVTPHSA
uniref:Uncharacterized protein n=1 Tax=Anguilla anguilla TaxID=7936 RepID=A0A0E9TZX3_ANGAN